MLVLPLHALPSQNPPAPKTAPEIVGPASIPPAVPAAVGPAERWTIAPVPARPGRDSRDGIVLTVDGRRVRFGGNTRLRYVDSAVLGTDGSVLIRRSDVVGDKVMREESIWFEGRETPIPQRPRLPSRNPLGGVNVYHDRRNYAGSLATENDEDLSFGSLQAYAVENGRERPLGPGMVAHWGSDGRFVLHRFVPRSIHPEGSDAPFAITTVDCRLLDGPREWLVPGYTFGGRQNDGTLVFYGGDGEPEETGEGPRSDTPTVLFWREGRWIDHVALPKGWISVGMSPDGWFLARPTPVQPTILPKAGDDPLMITPERGEAIDAAEEKTAKNWNVAVLRGRAFTPVTFPRPKGSEGFLWHDPVRSVIECGANAFRFGADDGDGTERRYRVARP